MQFKDVIGHNDIKEQLLASVKNGRISHAQLLSGRTGYGTLPLALAYAQYIFCTDKGEQDSCGKCPACHKMQKLIHPDLHFVYPVPGADNVSDDYSAAWRGLLNRTPYITLDDWLPLVSDAGNAVGSITVKESERIIAKLSLKSFEADYKIMLIWLPELMNAATANKLLKIIEEPYEKTLFIMLSEQPEMLLPTISSRVQRIPVPPLTRDDIKTELINTRGIDRERAEQFAKIAKGDWRVALEQLRENEDYIYNQEQFVALMRLCWERKMPTVNKWVDEISKRGREKHKNFLSHALRMLRESFMRNFGNAELVYMTQREEGFAERFAPYVHEGNIIPLCEEFERAYADIQANGNPKYIFTDLCIKVMQNIRP
ncbi:MAG: ATP-binding protein [Marinifilaceae bacterium]